MFLYSAFQPRKALENLNAFIKYFGHHCAGNQDEIRTLNASIRMLARDEIQDRRTKNERWEIIISCLKKMRKPRRAVYVRYNAHRTPNFFWRWAAGLKRHYSPFPSFFISFPFLFRCRRTPNSNLGKLLNNFSTNQLKTNIFIYFRFRKTFLSMGGGVHSADVFRQFRGRDPSTEAISVILV